MLDAIIKIGGSLISNKKTGVINESLLQGVAKQLHALLVENKRFIVLTGVGYHGHYPVKKFKLYEGINGKPLKQIIGLNETQVLVNTLRNAILHAFQKEELPTFMFYASSLFHQEHKELRGHNLHVLEEFLRKKIIPVITGDLVMDVKDSDLRVLSADTIATYFAKEFRSIYLIHLTDVPGVYTKNPRVNNDARLLTNISAHAILQGEYEFSKATQGVDVSGAMWKKTREIASAVAQGFVKKGIIAGYSDSILLDLLREEEPSVSKESIFTLIT